MPLKRVLILTMLLTISIVASLLDSLIPIPIKGVKLGVGNIVVILMIYKFSFKETLLVMIMRILMVSFLRGNFLSITFYMSISGGLLSFFVMYSCSKIKMLSIVTVSVFGAVFHCVGQIIVAMYTFGTANIIYYLPVMILLSILTGVFTGFISSNMVKNFDRLKIEN